MGAAETVALLSDSTRPLPGFHREILKDELAVATIERRAANASFGGSNAEMVSNLTRTRN
jgi:hypothetical protein